MDDAVRQIGAKLAIISAESGQSVASYQSGSNLNTNLDAVGQRFISLDSYASNLKIGPLNQLVAVRKRDVELSTRHPSTQTVSIVSAATLDKAFLTESLANDLLQRSV